MGTSVWVSSIVGRNSSLFWASAMSSLLTKFSLLLLTCLIDFTTGFLIYLRGGNIFLLWCVDDDQIGRQSNLTLNKDHERVASNGLSVCSEFTYYLSNFT